MEAEKYNLVSIDVFNTVLLRYKDGHQELVKRIYSNNNSKLQISEKKFIKSREKAEIRARQADKYQEPSILEIYKEFNKITYPQEYEISSLIKAEENAELELINPNISLLKWIKKIDRSKTKICFISDMYLSSEFIKSLLLKYTFCQPEDLVFVSCEIKKAKYNGSAFIYVKELMNVEYNRWLHIGDNYNSDYYQPQKLGITSWLYETALYTRHEQRLNLECYQNIQTIYPATVQRQLRLELEANTQPSESIYIPTIVNVIIPLIVSYTVWVINEAIKHNKERIYFASRDGYLIHCIATHIIQKYKLKLKPIYLYVSRLSLESALNSESVKSEALAYFKSVELDDSNSWLYVDLGWYGNMPKNLDKVISTEVLVNSNRYVYFADLSNSKKQIKSFINLKFPEYHKLFQHALALVELFCPSNHGTVLSYKNSTPVISSICENESYNNTIINAIICSTSKIDFSTFFISDSISAEFQHNEFSRYALECFHEFYFNPNKSEATSFGNLKIFDNHQEKCYYVATPQLSLIETLKGAIFDKYRPKFWWVEGTSLLYPNFVNKILKKLRAIKQIAIKL